MKKKNYSLLLILIKILILFLCISILFISCPPPAEDNGGEEKEEPEPPPTGKFKIANSWGIGNGWENDPDGCYWITYAAAKAVNLLAFYYGDIVDYDPEYIVTFEITHASREDCTINVYLATSLAGARVAQKRFDDYSRRGGPHDFPANIMVMDITEFSSYLDGTYDLYLEVSDINVPGGSTGTIDSFSIERYKDGYDLAMTSSANTDTALPLTVDDTTEYARIFKDDIATLTAPAPGLARTQTKKSEIIRNLFNLRKISPGEINKMKNIWGTFEPGKNYNTIIDGHGTGLIPPTEQQWNILSGNTLTIDSVKLSSNILGAIPSQIDLTSTQYFPPIGNQGEEGSCASFSTVYYCKTFMEAIDQNWDLSDASWDDTVWPGTLANHQDNVLSPDFVYHQINDGAMNINNEGSSFLDNHSLIANIGVATWLNCPYDDGHYTGGVRDCTPLWPWPNEAAWREAPEYRGSSTYYAFLIDSDDAVEAAKTLLANNILISTSVDANQYNFLDTNDLWDVGNYTPVTLNHANTIVGYEDD